MTLEILLPQGTKGQPALRLAQPACMGLRNRGGDHVVGMLLQPFPSSIAFIVASVGCHQRKQEKLKRVREPLRIEILGPPAVERDSSLAQLHQHVFVQSANVGPDTAEGVVVEDVSNPKILEACAARRRHAPRPRLRVVAIGAAEDRERQREVARTARERAGHGEIHRVPGEPSQGPG